LFSGQHQPWERNMNIIDKIRKLFAHAESAAQIGNQAEAEAFATKANELLLAHKLDATVIAFADDTPEELVNSEDIPNTELFGTKGNAGWRAVLFNAVAKAHFCRIVLSSGKVVVFGTPSDRAVAKWVFEQLEAAAPKLAAEAIPTATGWDRTPRRARNAWLVGFAAGIHDKLLALRAEQVRNPNALVIVNRLKEQVDGAVGDRFPRLTSARGPQVSHNAFYDGREAGRAHNVQRGVGGSVRSPLALGAGPR
jgi:hypothetical protein